MSYFKNLVVKHLKKYVDADASSIEVPPDPKMGDYAFPCFQLAKKMKKIPKLIAAELAEKIGKNKPFSDIRSNGPYVNFYLDTNALASHVFGKISADFGKGSNKKEKIMIEYSQVNTHKAFHVGHLRGTILGWSLVKLYRFSGYNTVAANYQGDIGAHVAKVIWYLKKHKFSYPNTHKGIWLGSIYQKANLLLNSEWKTDQLKEEVSLVLQKLEEGNRELSQLWKRTRKWSLDDFDSFYAVLGISFDVFFFESCFEKSGKRLVASMLRKGLAVESEGAIIIDLQKQNLGKFLLLKSDGTALYSTKDLALASEKFKKFKVDRSLYVVGSEQKLYFQQLFKTLEIMGFAQAKDCLHIPYGLVNLKGGKISSREGELIYAEELVEQVIAFAKQAVLERHPRLSQKEAAIRAGKIGIAAVKFSFLNQDNSKEIVFDKEKSLSFEGETGPYVQYTYARISSILRKAGKKKWKKSTQEMTSLEHNILRMLYSYPSIVSQATLCCRPLLLCRYLLDLCQLFNQYYHMTPILKAENKDLRETRLILIDSVRIVLGSGLDLLGIEVLEEM